MLRLRGASDPDAATPLAEWYTSCHCAGVRTFVVGRPEDVPLEPKPIDLSWILSGDPRARAGSHSRNVDGWAETLHWDCTAGRFRWHFGWEETVVILEGEVRVTDAAGTETTLRAGDVAYFPADTWFTWDVAHYVRKIAFCRKPVARPLRLIARAMHTIGALRART